MIAVSDKHGVLDRLARRGSEIHALGARRLALFGSFARDEQRESSDVDLLVEFEPGAKSFDSFMRLAFLLEDTLGRRVELVTTDSLNPSLRDRMLQSALDAPHLH
jgi:predicted nucleotidyltransferase